MAEELLIRHAVLEDAEKVFHLSNDPVVRSCSINTRQITWESHLLWFQRALVNPDFRFYIIESSDGHFVAQVRFKKEEPGWLTSISIHSAFRGKKLGATVLRLALSKMPRETIWAWVKETNIASQKIFETAEFCYSGIKTIEKENYLIFKHEA